MGKQWCPKCGLPVPPSDNGEGQMCAACEARELLGDSGEKFPPQAPARTQSGAKPSPTPPAAPAATPPKPKPAAAKSVAPIAPQAPPPPSFADDPPGGRGATSIHAQGETQLGMLFTELFTAKAPVAPPIPKPKAEPHAADDPFLPKITPIRSPEPQPDSTDLAFLPPSAAKKPPVPAFAGTDDIFRPTTAKPKPHEPEPDSTDAAFLPQGAADADAVDGEVVIVPEVPVSGSASGRIPVVDAPAKSIAALSGPRIYDLKGGLSAPGWNGLRRGLNIVFLGLVGATAAFGIGSLLGWGLDYLVYLDAKSLATFTPRTFPSAELADMLRLVVQYAAYGALGLYAVGYLGGWMCIAVPSDTRARGPLFTSLIFTTLGVVLLGLVYWSMTQALADRFRPPPIQAIVVKQMILGGLACLSLGAVMFTRFLKGLAVCLNEPGIARSSGRLTMENLLYAAAVFIGMVFFRFQGEKMDYEEFAGLLLWLTLSAYVGGMYLSTRMLLLSRRLARRIGGQVDDAAFPVTADGAAAAPAPSAPAPTAPPTPTAPPQPEKAAPPTAEPAAPAATPAPAPNAKPSAEPRDHRTEEGGLFWFDSKAITAAGNKSFGAYIYRLLVPHFSPRSQHSDKVWFQFCDGKCVPQSSTSIPHSGADEADVLARVDKVGRKHCFVAAVFGCGTRAFDAIDTELGASGIVGYLGRTSLRGYDKGKYNLLCGRLSLTSAFRIDGARLKKVSFDYMTDRELRRAGFDPWQAG